MKNKVTNILLAGVGGQGTLLASEVLSEALMLAGHEVKKSEIHGMSQRGGSVTSHVRFGPKVHSPLIPEGATDILFGFELLETYRNLPELRAGGMVIANDLKIIPTTVGMGKDIYPADIPEKIRAAVPGAKVINGLELAQQAGNARTVNVVLLGVLANCLELDEQIWLAALRKQVPEKFLAENLRAFELGQNC
ncbi:MAG: indolepyruvate oxidoreductase subunit beta [Desulfuromonadales bacterium]|nr:indolepyruvate oxidoreductase subunit beta [Desulfuromonadales bacterium]